MKSKSVLFLPLLAVAGLLLFSGCVGGGNDPVQAAPAKAATPTPTPTPKPQPEDSQVQLITLSVTPTPTPIPAQVSRTEAEGAVLEAISACTDGVSQGTGSAGGSIRLFFDSNFSTNNRSWVIEVDSADFAVTFGQWRVNEAGLLKAMPVNRVADRIANSGLDCLYPSVLLEADPAPPRFVEPSFGDLEATPTPGPSLIIGDPNHAAMRIWTRIYDCSQNYPNLTDFKATPYINDTWIVEGKSATTQYGLWQVDGVTGDVTALDDHAKTIVSSCGAIPIVLSGDQAIVRVWVATYDCYKVPASGIPTTPPNVYPPPMNVYNAYQDSPNRWVVEGRTQTSVLYGLWKVATDTGAITGLDAYARNIRAQACFQTFE